VGAVAVDVLGVGVVVDAAGAAGSSSPPHPAPNAASALTTAITIPKRSLDISSPFESEEDDGIVVTEASESRSGAMPKDRPQRLSFGP
jgi:hypothetical protein